MLDRVTQVTYSRAPALTVTHTYDDPLVPNFLGSLTKITRGSFEVDYEFDEFGRTVQDGELTFGYDANGNRTQIGYPGGAMATYTHDLADATLPDQTVSTTQTFQACGNLTAAAFEVEASGDVTFEARYPCVEKGGRSGRLYGTTESCR